VGIQAPGHRFPMPVRRPGPDLGFRFFGDSGLDGFGFARLNRIRGPANAGGLHGRAEEACRHSAQYTPRLANVKSLEEGVLGGDLAQVTDLSAEPLALLGPFGQQLFKVPQRGQRLEGTDAK